MASLSQVIGFSLGLATVALQWYGIYQLGVFDNACPTIHGRVCNAPWGICQGDTTCACVASFSGDDCTETLCPGYSNQDASVCNGQGFCSPFLTNVPASCNTSIAGSWASDQCAMDIAALDLTNFSQAIGAPQCICQPPWYGVDCRANMCPFGVELDICSGNGNTSVGFTNNETSIGTGCQCLEAFSLLDPQVLGNFSQSALVQIETYLLPSFLPLYCGVLLTEPGLDAFYVIQPGPTQCYCSFGWKGQACDLGQW